MSYDNKNDRAMEGCDMKRWPCYLCEFEDDCEEGSWRIELEGKTCLSKMAAYEPCAACGNGELETCETCPFS